MHFLPRSLLAAACVFAAATTLSAQTASVLTAEYDNGRTSANNNELLLSPLTVNPATFGKIGAWPLDGQVVGQPLYVPFTLAGGRLVDALYVATMNNSVYALDADHPGSAPLWKVNLGPAVPVNYAGSCPASFATGSQLGILSTPVIDAGSRTIYVVAANPVPNQPAYTHTLYALDLGSGAQKQGGSVAIDATAPGTGTGSSGGTVAFSRNNLIQRPALLLSKQTVYVGFSGCGPDPSPYHGWVLGYKAANIRNQTSVYNVTPNGDEGGIWQGGRGLVADNAGSIYFESGNGTTDDKTDFGESFIKTSSNGRVQDWFTPADFANLSDLDLDLSTTSPLLTPDTNLLIGSGKQGLIYVLHATSMGKSGNPAQTFSSSTPCDTSNDSSCQRIHSLAYWRSVGASRLYAWGVNDTLHAYRYANGQFDATAESQSNSTAAYPGGILSVSSALGVPTTGIVWALTPGELHAFSAANVSQELWNSNQNASRDALPGNYHFEQFTVASGKVFVPDNKNNVVVYGLFPK